MQGIEGAVVVKRVCMRASRLLQLCALYSLALAIVVLCTALHWYCAETRPEPFSLVVVVW